MHLADDDVRLRMVCVLETMNLVTIADFKTILNVGITDCFRFGYPNFNTLIGSFSDIFLCSAGTSEMSEVILNKQNIRKLLKFLIAGCQCSRVIRCRIQIYRTTVKKKNAFILCRNYVVRQHKELFYSKSDRV